MVHLQTVEQQLKSIGCNYRFWGRPEIKELAKILQPGEVVAQCTNGWYDGGIALLCVTDHRVLLIDRKPMFLTIEDIRFDMIAEIDFNHRLFNANVRIFSTNKTLSFSTWNHERLRRLVDFLQHHVMQLRHQSGTLEAQFEQANTPQQQLDIPVASAGVGTQAASTATLAQPTRVAFRRSPNPYTRVPLMRRHGTQFPRFY